MNWTSRRSFAVRRRNGDQYSKIMRLDSLDEKRKKINDPRMLWLDLVLIPTCLTRRLLSSRQVRLDNGLPKTRWANRFLDWPRDNETFALSFTPKRAKKGKVRLDGSDNTLISVQTQSP